jgi:hypothetical protein
MVEVKDKQAVGRELGRIYEAHGVLQPATVVEEARPEDSPLHPCFEWRDSVAAERHREWQARQIIRTVEIIRPEPDERPVQFVHVTVADRPQGYYPISLVVAEEAMFDAALAQLGRHMAGVQATVDRIRAAAKALPPAEARQRKATLDAIERLARAAADVTQHV